MSACEFQITFDRPDRTYAPGETVTGTAAITATEEVEYRRIVLTRMYRTHGRGNTTAGAKEEVILEGTPGALLPGETQEYAFEFPVPEKGPFTYHGHYLNVDWYARVQVDVAWARDPKGEADFLVPPPRPDVEPADGGGHIRVMAVDELPAPVREQLDQAADAPSVRQALRNIRIPGIIKWPVLGCFGLMFGLPILGGLISAVGMIVGDPGNTEGWGILAFLAGLFLFFGLFFLPLIRSRLLKRKLGAVDFKMMKARVKPGQAVNWFVRFRPTSDVEINDVRAILVGRERVVRGSGTNKTTYRHTLHREEIALGSPQQVAAGEDIVFPGQVVVPADAPYSFQNKLQWELTVHVDVANWPDWKDSTLFTVEP